MISRGLLLIGSVIGIGFALAEKKPKGASAPGGGGSGGGPVPVPPIVPPPGHSEGPDIVPTTPPFIPPGQPLPISLDACLDPAMSADEREEAVATLGFTVEDFHASDGGGREAFAAFLDAEAAKAAHNARPQYAFCLVAKSAAVRAGFTGAPLGQVGSFPKWS